MTLNVTSLLLVFTKDSVGDKKGFTILDQLKSKTRMDFAQSAGAQVAVLVERKVVKANRLHLKSASKSPEPEGEDAEAEGDK